MPVPYYIAPGLTRLPWHAFPSKVMRCPPDACNSCGYVVYLDTLETEAHPRAHPANSGYCPACNGIMYLGPVDRTTEHVDRLRALRGLQPVRWKAKAPSARFCWSCGTYHTKPEPSCLMAGALVAALEAAHPGSDVACDFARESAAFEADTLLNGGES